MPKRQFEIRARRPGRVLWLLFIGLGAACAFAYAAYLRGEQAGLDANAGLAEQHRELTSQIKIREQELLALKAELGRAEREALMDRTALSRLREELKGSQRTMLDLREENELYKGIVTPSKGSSLPQIVSFRLLDDAPRQDQDGHLYRFRVVLTSAAYAQTTVAGTIGLSITGEVSGELRNYAFSELSATDSSELRFRFKQYQRLEGRVKLPKDFLPRQVIVHATTESARKIERTFEWPAPLG
ncbi:MAG: hypothetical protein K0U93_16325 [Gammaproteobacteria bacterium]|nr:hypothetical protein [Gammaproteobacteria bacterium]